MAIEKLWRLVFGLPHAILLQIGAKMDANNLSIKNAPDDLVAGLKERAAKNHRSLQGELLAIIEGAVRPRHKLTPDEVLARIRRLGLHSLGVGRHG